MNPPRVNYLSPTDRLLALTYWPLWATHASIGAAICAALAIRDLIRRRPCLDHTCTGTQLCPRCGSPALCAYDTCGCDAA